MSSTEAHAQDAQTDLDGPTKAYSLRLTRGRVAVAAAKAKLEGLGLAELIDDLLLEYIEEE